MTKKRINEVKKHKHSFVCGEKCFNLILPFSSVNDKEFLRINATKIKNPCGKCTSACFPKRSACVCCKSCLKWYHLKCTDLAHVKCNNSSGNVSVKEFYCSRKCELHMMPFNTIKNDDSDIFDIPEIMSIDLEQSLDICEKKSSTIWDDENNQKTLKCNYLDENHIANVLKSTNSNLVVFHANVVSLKKNISRVEDLFQDCMSMPDILGVSETRTKDDSYLIGLKGYHFESCHSPTSAGGVGIYIRNALQYNVRDDLNLDVENCEDKWVEVIVDNSKRRHKTVQKIVIGIIYRHPVSNYKDFQEKLCSTIYELNSNKISFMIMGDLNINLLKYNLSTVITDYLNDVQSAGCVSFIDQPTRVCARGSRLESTCLDHIYSNIDMGKIDAHIIDSDVSDHFSTMAQIKGIKYVDMSKTQVYKRKKKLNNTEIVNFNADLSSALQRNNAFETMDTNKK